MNHDNSHTNHTPAPTDKTKHSGTGMTDKDAHGSKHAAESHTAHKEAKHMPAREDTESTGEDEDDGDMGDEKKPMGTGGTHPDSTVHKQR